jgi:hypothetical protein
MILLELMFDLLRISYKLGRQLPRSGSTETTFVTIKRLLKLWDIVPTENVERLKKDIRKAYDKRNEVAHGAWVRVRGKDVRLIRMKGERPTSVGTLDRSIVSDFAKQNLAHFQKEASYINGVATRVHTLQEQVKIELRPWPPIDPTRIPKAKSKGRP